MTTAFVPITVDVTGCRSCNNPKKSGCSSRNCKPRSTSRSTPMVREDPAVGPVERQIRRGESSHLEECSPNDSWVERPVTPTLLGYEIMEERTKFTVYKILVTGNQGSSWVIFRRYADFSRLNDKLKQLFPRFRLSLPPKRWFKDNYDMEFLEERQIGLQTFLQNLLAHKDIINSEAVRQFLCLDDPPNPFDRLEESRAFCETLEETNHRLQRELLEKQQEIDNLQIVIQEKDTYIELLERKASDAFLRKEMSDSPSQISVVSSDSCTCGEPEVARPDTYAEVSNDQQSHTEGNEEVHDGEMCSQTEADRESFDAPGPTKSHSAYWSTLVITDSLVPS